MKDFRERPATTLFISLMLTGALLPTPRLSTVKIAAAGNMPAAMSEALKGLGANGWTTPNDSAALPVASPASAMAARAPQTARISTDQLKKLIAKTQDGTVEGPVSQRMTKFLGLTRDDDKLIVKQRISKTDGVSHILSVPSDGNLDRLIFVVAEENRIRWIVTDRSGQLAPGNSGASIRRGEEPAFLSEAETQDLYKSEMTLWSKEADQL